MAEHIKLAKQAVDAGYTLEYHEHIDSTNARALRLAAESNLQSVPYSRKHFIIASEQGAGRGRRGAVWVSPLGNLYMTLLLQGTWSYNFIPLLGFCTGVALARTLSELKHMYGSEAQIALKWPNDLLLNGKKSSGILLETSYSKVGVLNVALGVGLNIATAVSGLPYETNCLHNVGIKASVAQVFELYSCNWVQVYPWLFSKSSLFILKEAWLSYAAGLGQPISVKIGDKIVHGIFQTIDENFCCVIRDVSGQTITIHSGDVYFGNIHSVPVYTNS